MDTIENREWHELHPEMLRILDQELAQEYQLFLDNEQDAPLIVRCYWERVRRCQPVDFCRQIP